MTSAPATSASHAHTQATAPIYRTAGGRVFNYNAGPSILPEEVIRQIQADIWNAGGTGFGIMEHSHRAKYYDDVLKETEAVVREIGNVPKNYRVLFMTGGSTSQNFLVPANLLHEGQTADYVVTGYWGQRSIDDAKQYAAFAGGNRSIHQAATSADTNHTYIPTSAQTKYSAKPAFVHITSNNTIYGTQWRNADGTERLPDVPAGTPIVCDACSDIYSRPIDFTKYGLVYASAQKNLGVTGTTIVFVRDDIVDASPANLPRMMSYKMFAKDVSMPNTPPAFSIYTVGLLAKWIKANGGVKQMLTNNLAKAREVYAAIDACEGFYTPHARPEHRSLMNIVFRCKAGEAMDQKLIADATAHGLVGLAGHRAAGGMRASLYNAMPHEGAVVLAQYLRDFAKRNG